MPVRGLGAKNVVFCGMRRSAAAAARICSTRDRAQQDRGVGVALLDQRGDGLRVVAVGERHAGHRGQHAGVEPRPSRRRAARPGARSSAQLELGGGHEQREPVAVDEAEAAAVAHRDLERGDALGRRSGPAA